MYAGLTEERSQDESEAVGDQDDGASLDTALDAEDLVADGVRKSVEDGHDDEAGDCRETDKKNHVNIYVRSRTRKFVAVKEDFYAAH